MGSASAGPLPSKSKRAPYASVVKLADALDSGSSGSNPLQVQVLSLAPKKIRRGADYGGIAQLVRALASHARGRRFESYCPYQA